MIRHSKCAIGPAAQAVTKATTCNTIYLTTPLFLHSFSSPNNPGGTKDSKTPTTSADTAAAAGKPSAAAAAVAAEAAANDSSSSSSSAAATLQDVAGIIMTLCKDSFGGMLSHPGHATVGVYYLAKKHQVSRVGFSNSRVLLW